MESNIHISLPAETIANIGPVPITNTLIITWLVMVFLILFSYHLKTNLSFIPNKLQLAIELIINWIYSFFETVVGENIQKFFPILATIFIFVLFANWTEIIPGMNSIKIINNHGEYIPILRSPSADLNFTLAIALISVIFIQIWGLKSLGVSYFKKFINLSGPSDFFVGILEIISEFAKIVSFSFRLFGNIFAGEVLLTVIAFLIPIIVPLPFLGLELFVGLIQAVVFSVLTAVFLNIAISQH